MKCNVVVQFDDGESMLIDSFNCKKRALVCQSATIKQIAYNNELVESGQLPRDEYHSICTIKEVAP